MPVSIFDGSIRASEMMNYANKMLYKIIESFSPADGDQWINYCKWRGVNFERFDSIDNMLRPDVFDTLDDEDWNYIVKGDYMLSFFTDLDYAVKKRATCKRGNIVGIKFDDHDESDSGFLGYDLIDGYYSISLLTNWGGNDLGVIDRLISPNALVLEHNQILTIQNFLHEKYGNDSHVEDCRIVSIYNPVIY